MNNEGIAAVDTETLKTVWAIRARYPGHSIDEIIFRRECKPGADVVAAALRASLLDLVTRIVPEFGKFLYDGQPGDALFDVFARFPLTAGPAEIDMNKLLSGVEVAYNNKGVTRPI